MSVALCSGRPSPSGGPPRPPTMPRGSRQPVRAAASPPARPARAVPGAGLAKWRTRCGRCGGLRAIPGRSARCTRTLATSPTPGASRRAPRSRATAHSRTARGAATTAAASSRIFDGLRGRRRAPSGRRARRPRTRGAACPSSRARGGRCVLTAHRGGERRKRRQRRRPSRPLASGPRVRRRGRRRRRGAATAATVLPPPPRHRRRAAAARHQRRPSPAPLVFQPRAWRLPAQQRVTRELELAPGALLIHFKRSASSLAPTASSARASARCSRRRSWLGASYRS